MCCGAIDRARHGYVAVVRRLVARRDRRRAGRRRHAGGLRLAVRQDPAKLSAGRGSRRHLCGAAASGRRLDQPNRGGGQAGRGHRAADPGRARRALRGGLELHRLHRIVEPGLLRHPAQALRGAHRSGAKRRRDHRPPAPADGGNPGCDRDFRSTCRPSSASATPAAFNMRWRRCRASRQPISPRRCARSSSPPMRARACGRVQHLRGRHAADLSRDRS